MRAPWLYVATALPLLDHIAHAHPRPHETLASLAPPPRQEHGPKLAKRVTCGSGIGSCPAGQCCSGAGFCGTTKDYCKGPDCQVAFSGSACDASQPPAGESTEGIERPLVGDVPYDKPITTCSRPGLVAITFDDGPSPHTSQLLDLLASSETPATFFITGNNAGKGMISSSATPWPAVLRRMHSEGHHLGSHTWSHADLGDAADATRATELVYNEMAFRDIFAFFPAYMRPPYAHCYAGASGCLDFVASMGYHAVDFNVDTKDYMHDSPALIQSSKDVFAAALGGHASPSTDSFIVLAHDTHLQTVTNLTRFMVETIREAGYRAVTLGECLGDPRDNWYRDAAP